MLSIKLTKILSAEKMLTQELMSYIQVSNISVRLVNRNKRWVSDNNNDI